MIFARLVTRFLGILSDGISLSFQEGLTSDKMLEYAYRNRPSGKGFIGRWIDKKFLSHMSWEAARIRGKSIEKLLIEAIQERSGPIRMLDIVSGPSSRILSVLKQMDKPDLQAMCQVHDPRRLEEGKCAAEAAGVTNVTFKEGKGFDAESLCNYKPHIALASDFYDRINDGREIKDSIRSVYTGLSSPGVFILTIQTDHPNLNMAQSVFVDFNKKSEPMTTRSANDMAEWLQSAGFLVEKLYRDPYGYFAVFKAKKT